MVDCRQSRVEECLDRNSSRNSLKILRRLRDGLAVIISDRLQFDNMFISLLDSIKKFHANTIIY